MNDTTLPSNTRRRHRPASVRPGFALHDWLALLRHAKDLSGRRGSPIRHDISLSEVSRHSAAHDGWMVLHGKVYNISPYLMYHPGGNEILEKCLGKDGTTLFEKYHAWVNVEGLIGPLLVGYLSKDARRGRRDDDEMDVGGVKYLDGAEKLDDGEENNVFPLSAVPSSSSTGRVEFGMPNPRPKKNEPIQSLLGDIHGNDSEGDEEAEEELL
ncbi:hypothetical protein ACHAWX_001667 [Stephanocyclus meneghinianus]